MAFDSAKRGVEHARDVGFVSPKALSDRVLNEHGAFRAVLIGKYEARPGGHFSCEIGESSLSVQQPWTIHDGKKKSHSPIRKSGRHRGPPFSKDRNKAHR